MASEQVSRWPLAILCVQFGFVACMGLLFSGLIGPWSLPFGIAAPLFGLGGALLSILGMIKTKERLYGALALLWAFFPAADLQLYGPTPKGTAIMTWNIGKPNNERFSCALDTLANWTSNHSDGLLFLQEIKRQ